MNHYDCVGLTSAEIGSLWYGYVAGTMSEVIFRFFLDKTQDAEVAAIVEQALQFTRICRTAERQIFGKEAMAIPEGFNDSDVDPKVDRLYSDMFVLQYLKHSVRQDCLNFGLSFSTATRKDLRDYFEEGLRQANRLDDAVTELMLHKGVYTKPPNVPVPTRVEYVSSEDFLGNIFGGKRMLDAAEIGLLHVCLDLTVITKALFIGFSQVIREEKLRNYLMRGINITKEHTALFSKLLTDNDLTAPMTSDADITKSIVPPFSDKLMVFHAISSANYALKLYGWGMSGSIRTDLHIEYARLMGEMLQYSEDGLELLIRHGWLEQPPLAANRRELALQR